MNVINKRVEDVIDDILENTCACSDVDDMKTFGLTLYEAGADDYDCTDIEVKLESEFYLDNDICITGDMTIDDIEVLMNKMIEEDGWKI